MVNQEQVLEILHAVGEKITEEKLFLTELDNVIGDGDHGINLARGFAEIEKKRPMMEGKDIGTMLKTAGMALVSTVGGASGPLPLTSICHFFGKSQPENFDRLRFPFCQRYK